MQPKNWINEFLQHRQMEKPDGRPLYQYRVTDKEFDSLQNVLRFTSQLGSQKVASQYKDQLTLQAIAKRLPKWNMLFVLYASEWWRRQYLGGQWSWTPIFASFDANADDLPTLKRNFMVEAGLISWQRKVIVVNGQSKYFGSIAIEGGLPLNCFIGENVGRLETVLARAYNKYIRLQNSGITALICVSDYHDDLPKIFQREEFYSILVDIIKNIAELKGQFPQLMQQNDPVAWLDIQTPLWRNEFPLPLNREESVALLTSLFRIRPPKPEVKPFHVTRQLFNDGLLQLTLTLNPFIFLTEIFPNTPVESIPPKMTVELLDQNDQLYNIGLAFKTNYQGQPALRLNRTELRISGEQATHQYSLCFKNLGDIIANLPLVGGEELDLATPWIFRQINEDWVFEGMASVKTPATQVRILYPETWLCTAIDSPEPARIAHINQRYLIEASGEFLFKDTEDNQFTVKTGQTNATPVSYHLTGNSINYPSHPKDLFRGIPNLLEQNIQTGQSQMIPTTQLAVKPFGINQSLRPLGNNTLGVYDLRFQDTNGRIAFRKKIALLPAQFSIHLKPGVKPNEGEIEFHQIGKALIHCDLNSGQHTITADNNSQGYRVALTTPNTPPAWVSFILRWPNQPEMLSLSVPFPARGAQLLDPHGHYTHARNLYQDSLHGFRLRLFNENPDQGRCITLNFNLAGNGIDNPQDLYFAKTFNITRSVEELALIDYLPWIHDLLAISNHLDAQVQITILDAGQEIFRVNILQYQMKLEINEPAGCVNLSITDHAELPHDVITQIRLKAMRINQPEQTHIQLASLCSETTEIGAWFFDPTRRDSGPWLIYSSEESAIRFRPILWNISPENEVLPNPIQPTTFFTAVQISDTSLRQQILEQLLNELSCDFNHNNWQYLDNLWRHSRHLPLATFNIWTLAVKNTKLLAALVLKMDDQFLQRLANELPVMWELIPLSDWHQVITQYRLFLKNNIPEDDPSTKEQVVNELLLLKLNKISQLSDCMAFVLRLLKSTLFQIDDREINFIQQPAGQTVIFNQLEQAYQELLRCQADNQWPIMLNHEITQKFNSLPQEFFNDNFNKLIQHFIHNINQDHRQTVILLPILLASLSLTEPPQHWIGNSVHLFKLKQLKTFDELWFNTAFTIVIALQYFKLH